MVWMSESKEFKTSKCFIDIYIRPSENCEHSNVSLNYWNINLKSQGVLQVNILPLSGLANKKDWEAMA